MGVTAIKSIANRTGRTVYHVYNMENPDDTGGIGRYIEIGPGENRRVNMWIPWCDNQSGLERGRRIVLEALGTIEQELPSSPARDAGANPESFSIWQSGDYVYFSLDDSFESAQLVGGNSTVNGDRSVEITGDGPYFY